MLDCSFTNMPHKHGLDEMRTIESAWMDLLSSKVSQFMSLVCTFSSFMHSTALTSETEYYTPQLFAPMHVQIH